MVGPILREADIGSEFYIPIINSANEDAADLKDHLLDKLLKSEGDSDIIEFAEMIGVKIDPESEELE